MLTTDAAADLIKSHQNNKNPLFLGPSEIWELGGKKIQYLNGQ